MSAAPDMTAPRRRRGRPRATNTDIDHRIGANLRRLRVQRGLTQQQFARMIGVTYQQAHKYEAGRNRIAASRLHQMALALDCDHAVFFENLETPAKPVARERQALEMVDGFVHLTVRQQDAVAHLVRALSSGDEGGDR